MSLFSFMSRSASRMRRSTLRSMMQMDPALLNDMGLTQHDIADAMRQSGPAAARLLDDRRTARATQWLR